MFSRFFIERPIFATVVSLLLCIAGLISIKALPIERYPSIAPIQITVATTYPGADSQTLASSVAAPIEAQLNGLDGMLYMTSTSSSTGQLNLNVFFKLDTDPDIAQVQVQNRVNLALPQLPSAVTQNGVSVQKKSATIMMLIAIVDKTKLYTPEYTSNYANVYVLDALKRVPGAGQAQIMGKADQAMRIWLKPERMAALGITTSDIQQAVSSQNALFGAGQLGQQPTSTPVQLTFPLITQRPFTDPKEYEQIILRASNDGRSVLRLKDVARVEVGLNQYINDSKLNGAPATFIAIYQQPGANSLQVADAVRQTLQELKSSFPSGIDYVISLDTTEFVRLSIQEVIKTLAEALVLVILVVYLFLQNFRATIICAVAIFVALIATFAGMWAMGFSINLLTLFGLVLAIGMVVDDAIVVVENVERNMSDSQLDRKQATIQAMQQIGGPVVAVVLVLSAVFIPASFLSGTTGQLYRQFALTIIVSVTISGFVALTLTPAMCALMLEHTPLKTKGFLGWFNRAFTKLIRLFDAGVHLLVRRLVLAFVLLLILLGMIVFLFRTIPTSFVPNEDQGYAFAAILMPDSASFARTKIAADKADAIFATDKAVENRSQVTGYSLLDSGFNSNAATLFITLKPFDERYGSIQNAREQNVRSVLINAYEKARTSISDGFMLPIPPPAIPGIGATGGFEFWIQDTTADNPARLDQITQGFLAKARTRPELTGLNTTFRGSTQQLRVQVDREKTQRLGVQVQDVYSTIQAQFGSVIVSQFNQFSRVWNVILQADAPYRLQPTDITQLYVRSNQGQMIPLSALVSMQYVSGPDVLPHFNGFPAAKIIGSSSPGYSSGQAIAAMESLAQELPAGYRFAWSGLAFEEKKSSRSSTIAFIFGLIIIFLILAAQYESWALPGAVMTAVPFGVLGALLANWARGLNNDVYFQIGLLVLIGLGAKNAVLRVSFAVELRNKGLSALDAAIQAGEIRMRPIVMTSLAFIFGVLPLAIALGAGANARHSIGTGIIGGMIGETTLAMLYVPLFYYLFDKIATHRQNKRLQAQVPNGNVPDRAGGKIN